MWVLEDSLLSVPCKQRQVEQKRYPVSIDQEEHGQASVDGCFGNDVGVQAVAEVDWVDVVTIEQVSVGFVCIVIVYLDVFQAGKKAQPLSHADDESQKCKKQGCPYHSRSLYMMVKKTWRKRLTAFIKTAIR